MNISDVTTICENRDFRRLYNRGKFFVHPALCTYVMKNRYRQSRIGITAGKKVGNAVLRNRSRRIIREGFRAVCPQFKDGFDIVFVARGKTPFQKSTDIAGAIEKSLTALGLAKQSR